MYPHQNIPQLINTYANSPSQPEFEVKHPITDLSFIDASANALDSGRCAQLVHPGQTPHQNDCAQQRSYGWDSRQWGSSGPIYYESSLDAQDVGLGLSVGQSSYQEGVHSGIGPSQV